MKKIVIILVLLLIGCAAPRTYVASPELTQRADEITHKVAACMETPEIKYSIMQTQTPNAFMNADGVITYTDGILLWNENTLIFIAAHEIAHYKLNHVRKRQGVSVAVTGIMMVANVFIPGLGYLNHVLNPAVTNNFSKPQELDADKMASQAVLRCFNIPIQKQIKMLQHMKSTVPEGGGFWDKHPSWDDRIANIQTP